MAKREKEKKEQDVKEQIVDKKLQKSIKARQEEILTKNLTLLTEIDLLDVIEEFRVRDLQMRELVGDLIDELVLDDAIVTKIRSFGEALVFEDLQNIIAAVEQFNIDSRFKTLGEGKHKELLKELLGPTKFESKLRKSRANKFKTKRK